jgi:hypothetical protein
MTSSEVSTQPLLLLLRFGLKSVKPWAIVFLAGEVIQDFGVTSSFKDPS